jgi:HAD superfamily hydrolase (TIGR01484 family)
LQHLIKSLINEYMSFIDIDDVRLMVLLFEDIFLHSGHAGLQKAAMGVLGKYALDFNWTRASQEINKTLINADSLTEQDARLIAEELKQDILLMQSAGRYSSETRISFGRFLFVLAEKYPGLRVELAPFIIINFLAEEDVDLPLTAFILSLSENDARLRDVPALDMFIRTVKAAGFFDTQDTVIAEAVKALVFDALQKNDMRGLAFGLLRKAPFRLRLSVKDLDTISHEYFPSWSKEEQESFKIFLIHYFGHQSDVALDEAILKVLQSEGMARLFLVFCQSNPEVFVLRMKLILQVLRDEMKVYSEETYSIFKNISADVVAETFGVDIKLAQFLKQAGESFRLMDPEFNEEIPLLMRLLNAGFPAPLSLMVSTLKNSQAPEEMIKAWQGYDSESNGDFDPSDALKMALEYNRFLKTFVLPGEKSSNEAGYTFEVFSGIVNSSWGKPADERTSAAMPALTYLSYETKKLSDFLMSLKTRADHYGRKMLVVPNYTYGWFISIPLREELARNGIKVADVRCGSTEAHTNEFVVAAAGKDRFFDEETTAFIMREKPVMVFVDGSNSFIRAPHGGGRYPDAHKAFVNNLMLINYVLAGNIFHSGTDIRVNEAVVDASDARDETHFLELIKTPDGQKTLSQYQQAFLDNKPESGNVYHVEYYNEMKEPASITQGGRHANRQVRAVPKAVNRQDIPALDLETGAVAFVTTVNVRDEVMPQYIKDFVTDINGGVEKTHETAGLDDNIDKFFVADRHGLRRSSVMEEAYKRQYAKVSGLVDYQENKSRSVGVEVSVIRDMRDVEALFMDGKQFGGVLLDIDGTIKKKGQKIEGEILEQIVSLLQKGYKVGVASGRSTSISKVFLNRIKRRLTDKSYLENLYIFEQNGAYGYRGGEKSILEQNFMNSADQKRITDELNNAFASQWGGLNGQIQVRSGIIAIEGVDIQQRARVVHDLRQNMGEWALKDSYDVFDTGVNINIMKAGVNKGRAAEAFARECGLAQKDILKVGNAYASDGNDYPMLVLPGGFGIDSIEVVSWLLNKLQERDPLSVPQAQNNGLMEETVKRQASYFRYSHKGIKVAVIGATSLGEGYRQEQGEIIGGKLADLVRQMDGWIFTGGVRGVGVDVFRGLAKREDAIKKFVVVLPQQTSVDPGYQAVLGPEQEITREIIGATMSDRRVGIALAADVLLVVNGGRGTLHEAVTALEHGRPIVVFPYGGIGEELYRMKEAGIIPEKFSEVGMKPEYLSLIQLAGQETVSEAVQTAYELSPKDYSQEVDKASKNLIDGGIDLNAVDSALQVKVSGEAVKFNVDPAMLAQYRLASGFEPVIINMQPMDDLPAFLGIFASVN